MSISEPHLHEHVDVFVVLEGSIEFDDKGRVKFVEDFLFGDDVILLSRVDDVLLLQTLQGECHSRIR